MIAVGIDWYITNSFTIVALYIACGQSRDKTIMTLQVNDDIRLPAGHINIQQKQSLIFLHSTDVRCLQTIKVYIMH